MAGVDSPGLRTIAEGRERHCMVDMNLSLTGEASPLSHDLVIDDGSVRRHTAKVRKLLSRLKLFGRSL